MTTEQIEVMMFIGVMIAYVLFGVWCLAHDINKKGKKK
jgi:hypothetical protein